MAGGAGRVNRVFTAKLQLITINSCAPQDFIHPIWTAGGHAGPLRSPWEGYMVPVHTLVTLTGVVYALLSVAVTVICQFGV